MRLLGGCFMRLVGGAMLFQFVSEWTQPSRESRTNQTLQAEKHHTGSCSFQQARERYSYMEFILWFGVQKKKKS